MATGFTGLKPCECLAFPSLYRRPNLTRFLTARLRPSAIEAWTQPRSNSLGSRDGV